MIHPILTRHLRSFYVYPSALLAIVVVGGCAREHHYREREAVYYDREPAVIAGGPIEVISDPDPVIVERERYYLNEPDAIVLRGNDYYYHDRLITDEREAHALRLAYQARESHYARHPELARGNHDADEAKVAKVARDAKEAKEAKYGKAEKLGRIDAEHRQERNDPEHREDRQ